MKARLISTCSALALLLSAASAAPNVSPADLSVDTLKRTATPKQQASIDEYAKAKERAEQERLKSIQQAKEITEKNNIGQKKRIQERQLNVMLPACERESSIPKR
ncbi:hypothetical protein [Akkermansia glycaniphila]|uniref:Uncharacterized protein n=1 Tax=Akkermansia glycaniphila TaxID=1679444 RepID=A0A1C7PCQ6_9BACT|nr:hypothetical protein [Akkermansia glycaniphila]MBT9450192.1 hypothetical protein [Akkermansia glycaniphila]OCA03164.1 hypothetical protein AC781_06500 [Akkermansia glycaniphila]SEH95987.1 Hypothetical protein PYTT_2095 [Akkermansia glycaniphila]